MDAFTLHTVIRIFLLLLIGCGIAYTLFALGCAVRFFRSSSPAAGRFRGSADWPPVSILKPLKGLDPAGRENLVSFCTQDYPRYELLLGFRDGADEGIPAAREVIAEARCDVSLKIEPGGTAANQKVLNLQALEAEARYSLLALSDSDMWVEDDYLKRIVMEHGGDEKRGLVTCLYKISAPSSAGSAFESLTIGLDFIPSVLVARYLEGVTFGLGGSILLSREALKEIGGFADIADYLADDYQLGFRLWKKGYENILSRYVLENRVGSMTIGDYFTHQLRWARTYKASRPKGFLGYGITHTLPLSLLLLVVQPGWVSGMILGGILALKYFLALAVYKMVINNRQWLKWLFLIPVKDIFSFLIWIWSFFGSTVQWRGSRYRILRDGRIVRL